MGSFSWKHASREEFDHAVEMLLVKKCEADEPGLIATAIEGRGGDGGIDIDVRVRKTGQLVRVYQLKHFPEGISGTHRESRLQQVKRSFNTVLQHSPAKWVLVIPAKFSTQTKKTITTFTAGHGVSVEYLDAIGLDLLLARFPEIRGHLESNPLREALEITGIGSAALNRRGDLARELQRIATRVDGSSVYWGRSFGVLPDGTPYETLHAKRPDAAEREPLSVQLTLDFSDHPEASKQWDNASRFGSFEPIHLPAEVVKKLERIGPEWFASTNENVALEFHPSTSSSSSRAVKLTTIPSPAQRKRVSIRGTITGEVGGTEGTQLRLEFPGGLRMTWLIPDDRSQGLTMELTFEFGGQPVAEVRTAATFLQAMPNSAGLSIELDDVRFDLNSPESRSFIDMQVVLELADDLLELQKHLGPSFLFPGELSSVGDRIRARVLRGILEGKVHVVPFMEHISVTASGENPERLKQCLRDDGAVYVQNPFRTVELYGETIELDEVSYYHPSVRAIDSADHLKALLSGDAAGREIEFRPIDPTEGFQIYVPSLLQSKKVQPWNITGIHEYSEAHHPLGPGLLRN